MKRIFLNSIKRQNFKFLFGIIFLFFLSNVIFANTNQTKIDEGVLNTFNKARDLYLTNNYENYVKANSIIQKLESKLKKENKIDQLLYLYLEQSYFYITQYDYNSAKKKLDIVGAILKKHTNNCIKGEYFEHLAVYYNSQGNEAEDEKYTLLSEQFLSKYAPKEKQIDLNFNLAILYLKKERWEKSLKYSLNFLDLIKQTGGDLDEPEVFLFIAESYHELNNPQKALEYLDKVKNSNIFQNHDEDFLLKPRYYLILGRIQKKMGNYIEATKSLDLANEYFKKRLVLRVAKTNKSLNQKSELQIKNIEFQSIIKQNELKEENIKYKNYLLIICLAAIVAMSILLYFQYKSIKFKAKSNQILDTNNAKLEATNKELNKALSIKKKLLDTISHELRTPINTLSGTLYLVEHNKESFAKNYDLLNSSVQNLLNLSNSIIELHVLENLETDFVPKNDKIHIPRLLSNIIDTIRRNRNNNNQARISFDKDIPENVIFDKEKLNYILYSLIDNAFKFSKDNIININVDPVSVDSEKVKVQFEIIDNGIGIDPKMQSKIQELFVQGSQKINYEFGGSGLGLALVSKILKLFNQNLTIDSAIGKGTKMSFMLELTEDKEVENIAFTSTDTLPTKKEFKILLVEDNKINQLMTKKILTGKGYICEIADNGLEAVKLVQEKDYDLILMDIMMPVMDGFEASVQIAKLKPTIPIVALTAISEINNRQKFEETKIQKVIPKPVNVEELFVTVESYHLN